MQTNLPHSTFHYCEPYESFSGKLLLKPECLAPEWAIGAEDQGTHSWPPLALSGRAEWAGLPILID